MRNCFFLVIVLLSYCKCYCQKDTPESLSHLKPTDKKIHLTYEVDSTWVTYCYEGNKKRRTLSRVIYYDKNGLEKHITYIDYDSYVPATIVYMYDSTGRKTEEFYLDDELPAKWTSLDKMLYKYGENGKLEKKITFEFTRRMKEGIVRGSGTSGGCIVRAGDYEKKKTWDLEFVWNYAYDKKGRLIDQYQPYPENGYQNRYLYKYDERGRVLEEQSLSEGHIYYIDNFKYYDSAYEHTKTFYEDDGTVTKNSKGNTKLSIHRCKADRFNNVVEDRSYNEEGLINQAYFSYDEKNRLIKEMYYDYNDKLLVSYVHKYTALKKPKRMSFSVSE